MKEQAEMQKGDLFTTLTSFSPGVWRNALSLINGAGLAFLAGGVVAGLLALKNKISASLIPVALAMALCFAMLTGAYSLMGQYFSLAGISKAINQTAGSDALVVCEGEPHLNSSLFFYLDRPVHWTHARADNEFAIRSLQLGSELYLSEEELASQWRSSRQVFLIIENTKLSFWERRLALTRSQLQSLGQSGTRIVLVNH
jgi:hypothetical protein